MLYKRLYIHTYSLALKSKSNNDTPWFISGLIIFLCLMFNIQSLFFFIGSFDGFEFLNEDNIYEIITIIFFNIIIFINYYSNNNYKKVYESYIKLNGVPRIWLSILTLFLYYSLSLFLLFLAAFYKNKDWIFSS
ncbi:hypothetical protein FLCU109888_11890 [Flavobacterium cucumis]